MFRGQPKEIDVDSRIEGDHHPLSFKLKTGDYVRTRIPEQPSDVARVVDIHTPPDGRSKPRVLLKWFLRPKDCPGGKLLFHVPKEIIFFPEAANISWHSIDEIERKCKVHSLDSYTTKVGNDEFFYGHDYDGVEGSYIEKSTDMYCNKCKELYDSDNLMPEIFYDCEAEIFYDCEEKFHPDCTEITTEEAITLHNKGICVTYSCEVCNTTLIRPPKTTQTQKEEDKIDQVNIINQ